ncbi:methyltransferase [Chromatiaceae bacterium AAb-1]|nr:methyltransferase [Chromatiaceae bacterium AAb-1]
MKKLTSFLTASVLLFSPLISADSTLTALEQAASHPVRPAQHKARDIYRNPVQTLAFFEVTPTSTVIEIAPGNGWYTEILAPLLSEKGKLYAAHFPEDSTSDYAKRNRAAFIEKLAANPVFRNVTVTGFAPIDGIAIAPAGTADVVLTFRNLHNWYSQNGEQAMLAAFSSFYQALKPGGVLGVVEHRLPETRLHDENWVRSGYFPPSLAIKLAEQAGFIFDSSSEINANSKDTADHPGGVWTLPPTLRLGEQDKEKYLAIGESDRMTLKFRKPQ